MLLTMEYDDGEQFLCLTTEGSSGAIYPCAKEEVGQFVQQYVEDYCLQSKGRME